jgi:hypothetical protein
MSESDQFRQYAEEAMRWVAQSKTEEEKQLLIELLCTWTAAAVASRSPSRQNTLAVRPRAQASQLYCLGLFQSPQAVRARHRTVDVIDQNQRSF